MQLKLLSQDFAEEFAGFKVSTGMPFWNVVLFIQSKVLHLTRALNCIEVWGRQELVKKIALKI